MSTSNINVFLLIHVISYIMCVCVCLCVCVCVLCVSVRAYIRACARAYVCITRVICFHRNCYLCN